MKKILKIISFVFLFLICNQSFAAEIDHFDVKLWAEQTSVDKAVDLTIEAKDVNWNTVTDYVWNVLIMSDTDAKAILPKEISDSTYTFKASDQWVAKFENALIFKTIWKQTISVIDLQKELVVWMWTINVSWDSISSTWVIEINIISPEDWTIISQTSVNVTWNTQKNHKVKVKLNWTDVNETTSNDQWYFETLLVDVPNWESIIKAALLDADNNEISLSNEVKINVKSDNPEFKSIKILPSLQVEAETPLDIELVATEWLNKVTVVINDEITKLVETDVSWIYTWITLAPKEIWTYDVDAILINELWNQTSKRPATKLEIIPVDFSGATDPQIVQVCASWATSTWTVDCPDCEEFCSWKTETKKIYKITNLQLTKLKTKSILSWDPISEATWYNVYKQLEWNKLSLVDTVTEARYEVPIVWNQIKYEDFVVEAIVNENWNIVKWELSEVTKIQTWPKELLIFLVLSLVLWFFITTFKRKNA